MSRPPTTPEQIKAEAEMLARLNSDFAEKFGGRSAAEIRDLDRDEAITLEQIEALERDPRA